MTGTDLPDDWHEYFPAPEVLTRFKNRNSFPRAVTRSRLASIA
jgi:hypothetical protein